MRISTATLRGTIADSAHVTVRLAGVVDMARDDGGVYLHGSET